MPIYEYKCDKCESIQEVIASVSEPCPTTCQRCSSLNSLRKIISKPSTLGRISSHEEQAMEYVSTLNTSKGLGVKRPYNYIKDEDGHYEPHDPADPKIKEFHGLRQREKVESAKKSREQLDKAYTKIAKGEDALKKSS